MFFTPGQCSTIRRSGILSGWRHQNSTCPMLGTLYYHYSRLGLAGLKAAFFHRLQGRAITLEVRHPEIKHPVALRIGTTDIPTFEQVLLNKEYDFITLSPPALIVDAGANIGLAAVLLASRYPQARIVAIEPESANFELLLKNTRAYPNIIALQAALWGCNGEIELMDSGLGHWGFTTRDRLEDNAQSGTCTRIKAQPDTLFNGKSTGTTGIRIDKPASGNVISTVPALTVAQVLQDQAMDRIDILKIDIEGAEREVFQNASDWIGRVQSIIVELHEHMKPGCRSSFESIAGEYSDHWVRGENIYLSRPGIIAPALKTT